jgi:hypothetical protein
MEILRGNMIPIYTKQRTAVKKFLNAMSFFVDNKYLYCQIFIVDECQWRRYVLNQSRTCYFHSMKCINCHRNIDVCYACIRYVHATPCSRCREIVPHTELLATQAKIHEQMLRNFITSEENVAALLKDMQDRIKENPLYYEYFCSLSEEHRRFAEAHKKYL